MGGIDGGALRQRRNPLQARPHLLRGTLEESTAPHGEQRISREQYVRARRIVSNMTQRVAAYIDHLKCRRAELDDVSVADPPVDRPDSLDLLGSNNLSSSLLFENGVPAGMVGMPMRVQDQFQRPTQTVQLVEDCLGIRRIDACRPSGLGIVHQKAVVIGQAWEEMNVQAQGTSSPHPSGTELLD